MTGALREDVEPPEHVWVTEQDQSLFNMHIWLSSKGKDSYTTTFSKLISIFFITFLCCSFLTLTLFYMFICFTRYWAVNAHPLQSQLLRSFAWQKEICTISSRYYTRATYNTHTAHTTYNTHTTHTTYNTHNIQHILYAHIRTQTITHADHTDEKTMIYNGSLYYTYQKTHTVCGRNFLCLTMKFHRGAQ